MSDPNQPYVPQAYPKMLYRDRGAHRIVNDETEADEAAREGYVSFYELGPADADGLDLLTDDQLRAKLLGLASLVIQARPRRELIAAIRFQQEQAAAENARTNALSADAVRAAEIDAEVLTAPDAEKGDEVIYGSTTHPEVIAVAGLWFHAAAIVGAAFNDSGLSVPAWNETPPSDRNTLIQLTIDRLAEAGDDAVIAELGEEAVAPAPEPPVNTDIEAFVAPVIEAESVEVGDEHIRWARDAVAAPAEKAASAQSEPEATADPDPLDHDHDGQPGGSLAVPEPDAEKAQLIADIAALTGRKPHPGSKIETLRAKLDDLTKPEA